MSTWAAITYCDFYDVPRAFVIELAGRRLLFASDFLVERDDYDDCYEVFELPLNVSVDGHWTSPRDLPKHGLARVPVAAVRFDATQRAAVDVDSLGL